MTMVRKAQFMRSTPWGPAAGPDDAAVSSISDQAQWLIDTHNRKRETHRFCSVDDVARDLGLPPRPRRNARTWVLRIAEAVEDELPLLALVELERRSREPAWLRDTR